MNLHPQFIGQNGAEEYAILPIKEFRALTEVLEDYQDIKNLRSAKRAEATQKSTSLPDVISELDLR
ncbi:prevent-host-death family protein [Chromatium okenii]|uniref:type II toxin-antitoxin system Phd/YefM family antitoxin n=1 Tax=Chromatium okenii TaxID=61644 RepID=UPI001904DBE0|nr:type II toxin-antitoxin system Phd/YefM family antitoxin [Chromatium okenii]MBK1640583.1 prevent-host-death family protein [Chromatium okenii]